MSEKFTTFERINGFALKNLVFRAIYTARWRHTHEIFRADEVGCTKTTELSKTTTMAKASCCLAAAAQIYFLNLSKSFVLSEAAAGLSLSSTRILKYEGLTVDILYKLDRKLKHRNMQSLSSLISSKFFFFFGIYFF
jgi:hypothetical protein